MRKDDIIEKTIFAVVGTFLICIVGLAIFSLSVSGTEYRAITCAKDHVKMRPSDGRRAICVKGYEP
jgi:hypothetical protein